MSKLKEFEKWIVEKNNSINNFLSINNNLQAKKNSLNALSN